MTELPSHLAEALEGRLDNENAWVQQAPRTQMGFRYRNGEFAPVWTTSQPQSIEAALEYFDRVASFGLSPRYLEYRASGQDDWTMVRKQYVNGEVIDV